MPTTVTDTRAILADYVWNGRPTGSAAPVFISYSFEASLPAYLPASNDYSAAFRASFRPLTFQQQETARAAFTQWDQASGIHFFEVPSGMGGIKLASFDLSLDEDLSDAAGVFTGRFSPNAYAPKTIIMVDDQPSAYDTHLYLHEIGHAIGLKHAFEGEFVLPPAQDNTATTTMSYTLARGRGETLGPLDLAAVAERYGTDAQDGRQVTGWSWDAATYTLTQTGGGAADDITGIGGGNLIDLREGDDRGAGADGPDVIRGGGGADILFGFGGNDHLYGQSVEGGPDGADTIRGGDGGDYIQGNAGADLLFGGDGSDRIQGGRDDDTIDGDDGNDSINGNLGADSIDGGAGNDSIRGGQGNDWLRGGDGGNVVMGDLGDDTLVGGRGADLLYGGEGADTFVVQDAGYADRYAGATIGYNGPNEVIMDFQKGIDHIQIGRAVTGIATGSANTADQAGVLAMSLLTGSTNLVAIAVGGDSYLYFSGQGPVGYFGVKGAAPGLFAASDFI